LGREDLKVVVFPANIDTQPYEMTLKIKSGEHQLRTTLSQDYFYWWKLFKNILPVVPPREENYKVYRKDVPNNHKLHIIWLKFENFEYKRNPHALLLEQICDSKFYGPLVVCYNSSEEPFLLESFSLQDLNTLQERYRNWFGKSKIKPMNSADYTPPEMFDNIEDEYLVNASLDDLKNNVAKETFFMYWFKTEKCPRITLAHDYKDCSYFHSEKDKRRKPDEIRYSPDDCLTKDCSDEDCDFSHNLFERLYHPLKYKVSQCDKLTWREEGLVCPWGISCAHYHNTDWRVYSKDEEFKGDFCLFSDNDAW